MIQPQVSAAKTPRKPQPSRIPRPVAKPKKNPAVTTETQQETTRKKPDHAFMTALSKPHHIPLNTPGAEVADRFQKNIRTVVFGTKDEQKPKAQLKELSSDFLERQKALSKAKKKYEDDLKAPVPRSKNGKVNPETTSRLAQPKHTRTKGEKKAIRDFTQQEFASHAFPNLYLRQDFEKNRPLESQSSRKPGLAASQ
ncbi:hypothetical protein [Endozoicomonas numazuensis]|uniref:Uncharacterized protein n=1 Tax=Endozoicomonas numazuensis TaxID=1137799 RepID=A0A081NJZ6_9GAMM|nr:hypothetical protein [Endozoicomonas numazuensis]KEQ18769.1 hypothetical protein GZ78_01370 [Endozoicomonas numazuensis]